MNYLLIQTIHILSLFYFQRNQLLLLKRQKFYSCVIVPEITNILNLIKVNNIILYGLIENQQLISLYIYRDAATFYNKEKTMECIASLSACPFKDIFLAGFLISIQKSSKY